MRRISWNTCVCVLVSISLASCGSAKVPGPPPSTVLKVADASLKSKVLAKIVVLSPAAKFEVDPREEIVAKGGVTIAEGERGPESLRLLLSKPKARHIEFGSFGLVPEQRDVSYEFEAKLPAPKEPGRYELRWIGTYELQGPDGRKKLLDVDSNIVEFTVRK